MKSLVSICILISGRRPALSRIDVSAWCSLQYCPLLDHSSEKDVGNHMAKTLGAGGTLKGNRGNFLRTEPWKEVH